ncbi:MAG: lipoprotein insertase outer membrane protein LolB [Rhodocyclaceae bacterium]|nr:lipoprotein insertase outer membrane protein LolB [Rhodocyclaceae bacterium]
MLLAGCEALPPRQAEISPRPARAGISAFSLDGRVAARQDQTRHYANIAWHHTAAADDILLTTPLGQGVAELSRDAAGARLVSADQQVAAAPDWESLSAQVFGFALPLAGMPRWLLGDVAATQRDDVGRPLAASADGWDIRYLDYESPAADALPVLMEFRRDDIELRLKVDSWQLN